MKKTIIIILALIAFLIVAYLIVYFILLSRCEQKNPKCESGYCPPTGCFYRLILFQCKNNCAFVNTNH